MKTPIIWITVLCIAAMAGCSKPGSTDPVPVHTDSTGNNTIDTPSTFDMITIPTGEARWYLHYQGATTADTTDPRYSFFDTNYHMYTTITAAGNDSVIKGQTHYIYTVSTHIINKRLQDDSYVDHYMCASYDSLHNRMSYYTTNPFASTPPLTGIEFDLDKLKGSAPTCMTTWYSSNCKLAYGDSITIHGVRFPALYMDDGTHQYFYQAIGVGGIGAITNCPDLRPTGERSILRSLDFVYRKDSLHFEYPYVR